MTRSALALIVLMLLASAASAQPKTYAVYFLGGQSNMNGHGDVADLPDSVATFSDGVTIYQGHPAADGDTTGGRGRWAALQPGHGAGFSSDGTENAYSEHFGVELTFARRLRALQPGTPLALIKYAKGGSALDTAAAAEFGAWDPAYARQGGVNQYDHFLATLRGAFAQRDLDGDGTDDELVPAGIIWMQGESDGAHGPAAALRYRANLERLMGLIRAALRVDDLPVVIGRISDSGQDDDGTVWDYGAVIRAAQAAFVQDDANAALVTSTDDYAYSDPWHYDSAGYLDLGRRFAEAMVALQKGKMEDRR